MQSLCCAAFCLVHACGVLACSWGTHTPEYACAAQHELSHQSSEMDGHRRKRPAVNPAELQQALSTLVGRPLGDAEMSKIFPSFPEGIDFSFSGALPHSPHALSALWF
jgi:hypothetical protein